MVAKSLGVVGLRPDSGPGTMGSAPSSRCFDNGPIEVRGDGDFVAAGANDLQPDGGQSVISKLRAARGRNSKSWVLGMTVALGLAVSGCATVPDDPDAREAYEEANDPLEPMNRYFFEVNYAVDELVLKPFAGWYYIGLPDFARDGIRNALDNLKSPVIFLNDLLQGEPGRAGVTLGRFVINSTLGIAGLIDVADEMGLTYHDEDFGQTLAVWGSGEGPYLVIPFIGPSNMRDAAGLAVDTVSDPFFWIARHYDVEYMLYIRAGLDVVDARSRNLQTLDEIRRNAIDYYATIRSLYRQDRSQLIANDDETEDDEE
jgi:phospholipid-binding lipoprotein MlaA